MVPNGWKEGKVKDLISSLDAGVSVNSEDDGNREAEYKILKTSSVSNGVFEPFHAKAVYEPKEINRLKEKVAQNTIIISRMNTPKLVGANGYVENTLENTFLPDRLWQLKPKKSKVVMRWLGYWFSSEHTRFILSNLGTGTSGSMKNITKSDVLEIKLNIPPLPEQKKIAQILSTWDKAIITTERLLANSEQQKKALMQQLLTGRRRFPGFSEKWENVRLGNVADMNSGGTPKSSKAEYYEGDIPWVSIADMTQHGKYIVKTKRNITLLGLKNSSAKLYPENTVLYAMYASIGECSIAKIKLTSSQAILGIRPKSELNNFYLYFYLSSLKNKIKLQGQQGTQSNLNAEMVKNFRFKLPLLHEQTKIVAMLTVSDQEIETLQQKLRYLKQEKKALMQQLLTGKRRVK